MDDIFGLLALLCIAFDVFVVFMWVGSRFSASGEASFASVRRFLDGRTLWVAWAVALVATFGSLFYSEVRHFPPCRLCWFQRIGIYPLSVLLGIAAFTDDRRMRAYVLPLNAATIFVSLYHITLELYPQLEGKACKAQASCTLRWVEAFGFLTLPRMAFITSVTVAVLMLLTRDRSATPAP